MNLTLPDTPASLFVARDIFDQNKTLSTYLAETVESYSQDIPGFTLLSSDIDSAQLQETLDTVYCLLQEIMKLAMV